MSHLAQQEFFRKVKKEYPEHFHKVRVLDCGSLDVNGTIKDYFTESEYTGVDIAQGRNVDMVSHIKDLTFEDGSFDTVVSGEMLEHDETWRESLQRMYDLTRHGGLIAITCAGEGRKEHGTRRTGAIWGTSDDYYMNLTEDNFREVFKDEMFTSFQHEYNATAKDQYFYGVKA
jgi:SAM-dependent methyltransferase